MDASANNWTKILREGTSCSEIRLIDHKASGYHKTSERECQEYRAKAANKPLQHGNVELNTEARRITENAEERKIKYFGNGPTVC